MRTRSLWRLAGLLAIISSTGMAAKKPGTARIGVVAIQDKAGHGLGYAALDGRLLNLLRNAGFDPKPLRFQPAADVEHEAREAGCALILYTNVVDVRKAVGPQVADTVRGVGKVLGKSESRGRDIWEAEIEFRLFAVDQVLPLLSTSVTGKNMKSKRPGTAAAPAPAPAPNPASPATISVSEGDPNLLSAATPAEMTGRQRKHRSVAVAAAMEREVKLVRERVERPTTSAENQ